MPVDYQETIINMIHAPDKRAHVWTVNRRVKTRLAKLGFEPIRQQNGGNWYDIPIRCILFKSPKKRTLSDGQKAEMRTRLDRSLNRDSQSAKNRRAPHGA